MLRYLTMDGRIDVAWPCRVVEDRDDLVALFVPAGAIYRADPKQLAAQKLASELRARFPVFYDESGAIGRRYRRQDEVGTPFCLTVDGQTMADGTVTVRDRDSLAQERVAAEQVNEYIARRAL